MQAIDLPLDPIDLAATKTIAADASEIASQGNAITTQVLGGNPRDRALFLRPDASAARPGDVGGRFALDAEPKAACGACRKPRAT